MNILLNSATCLSAKTSKKMLGFLVSCFGILLAATEWTVADQHVQKAFQESKIVPDLINVAPGQIAKVMFNDGEAELGNTLEYKQSQSAPQVIYEPEDENDLYAMLMADPDAPGSGSFLHWLVINIPGSDPKKGQEKATYYKPTPPPGTGKHRYVFLVYKQRASLTDVNSYDTKRGKFNLKDFAKTHGLGDPEYGNFFLQESAK